MLNALVDVILLAINFIETALFIWIILNLLIQFNILNTHQELVVRIRFFLDSVFNPLLRPIRRYVPAVGGFDLSPIALILMLYFIKRFIIHTVMIG